LYNSDVHLQALTPRFFHTVIPAKAEIQRNTGPTLLITCYPSLFFHSPLITVFRPNELNQGYGFEKEG